MSDADPADPTPPASPTAPLIVFAIPGKWSDRTDLVARLAAAPGGYVVDGPTVRDANTGRAYGCDLRPRVPGLADAFFAAGGGRIRRADALAVGNHASVVRLTGFGGSVAAAVEMMRVATVVLAAGGIAVLVESSGLAHTADEWLNLAGGRDPGAVYWAYVTLVAGGEGGGEVAG
ncbi:MAG: hypothetical protein JWO31_2993 [Phycisphaerales bacterium]|nr:hypothetical protein [Phycisphaerales bacterium]